MDINVFVSVALGLVVPVVVSFLKNAGWSKAAKVAVAVVVSAVAASASLIAQGEFALGDLAANTAIVWASAQAFYTLHFQGTEFNAKLEVGGPFAT